MIWKNWQTTMEIHFNAIIWTRHTIVHVSNILFFQCSLIISLQQLQFCKILYNKDLDPSNREKRLKPLYHLMYKLKGVKLGARKISPDLTIIFKSKVKSFHTTWLNRVQFIPFNLATFILTDCSLRSWESSIEVIHLSFPPQAEIIFLSIYSSAV